MKSLNFFYFFLQMLPLFTSLMTQMELLVLYSHEKKCLTHYETSIDIEILLNVYTFQNLFKNFLHNTTINNV